MCTRAAGTLMGPAAHQDLQQGLTDASTLVGSSWHRGPTTGPAFADHAGKVSMKGSLYINSLTVLSIIMLLYVIYK